MLDSPPWMSDFISPCSCGRYRAIYNSSLTMTNTEHSTPQQRSLRGREVTQRPECAARHFATAADYRRESKHKFTEFQGTVDEFLDTFAPSPEKSRPPSSAHSKGRKRTPKTPFHKLNNGKIAKDERLMYQPLVEAFTILCKEMDEDRRPTFYEGHDKHFLFPYTSERHSHTYMSPDIVALPPGTMLGPDGKPDRWEEVCFVIEVKGSSHDDPIDSHSEQAEIDNVKIMRDGGSMMLAHGLLCAFVIVIYGKEARIFRIDHAGAVCSQRFNYIKQSEVMREFVWRFFRPNLDALWIGADDTCRPANRADLDWARGVCTGSGGAWNAEAEEVMNRWVKVPLFKTAGDISDEREYLTLRPIYIDPNTFCRATCVRQAVLKDDPSGTRYVVKDAWRQRARKHAEKDFYAAIEKYAKDKDEPYFGIAKMVAGVDLGRRNHDAHRAKSQSANAEPKTPDPKHYYDRYHMRIVLDTVGIPLDEFPSTKIFTKAIRDAIRGHRLAFRAGVLHRDVSKGNILILLGDTLFKGFICDFDYSSFVDSSSFGGIRPDGYTDQDAVEHDLKERTGTFRYFAVELLKRRDKIIHGVHHDLESFYWVIVWIVLRHTDHDHGDGPDASHVLFGAPDEATARSKKESWLVSAQSRITIRGNIPLTNLLNRLRSLVASCVLDITLEANAGDRAGDTDGSQAGAQKEKLRLTYEAFLEILDAALDDGRWPENDKARKFVCPPNPEKSKNAQAGTKRTRNEDGGPSNKKQKISEEDVPAPSRIDSDESTD
ncbi:hypothetical protein DAEQUDRAFT_755950 [Daedalea quercina L-15889]|uniref:Fungal-type protein kinase domain-containing protein n=1 Tax=Daedalea quercina L-15889 TaxID=1314783 RepID=A0A165RTW8_9APHY|nr:hypothetical protein DAEQUDRAFT_755950 [Daedalea quercina L-15889]